MAAAPGASVRRDAGTSVRDERPSARRDAGTSVETSAVNVRVLLCHDRAVLRRGLERLLQGADGIEVVAAVADGGAGVSASARLRPDVVLMDLAMPRIDAVLTTRRIVALEPRTRVLILTGFADPAQLRDAMDAGAAGYVLKDAPPEELLAAVRSVAERPGWAGAG
jgi:DNA-binding NarL/FixJ family response regulator